MAMQPVARAGDTFSGYCSSCEHDVTGTIDENTCEFVVIDGARVCVDGTTGTGSCGHTCTVVAQSITTVINDKAVARLGDPVTGTIEGSITSGSDFVSIE